MDLIVNRFLERNLPDFKENIIVDFAENDKDFFCITSQDGKIFVTANNYIFAFHGIYCYLKNTVMFSFRGAAIRKYILTAL